MSHPQPPSHTHRIRIGSRQSGAGAQTRATIPAHASDVLLCISHKAVVELHIAQAIDTLLNLTDEAKTAQRFAHRLSINFEHHTGDPIQAARDRQCLNYLFKLNEHWNYWLHFLAPTPENWLPILSSLAHAKLTQPNQGAQPELRIDVRIPNLKAALHPLALSAQQLHLSLELPPDEAFEVFSGSMDAIEQIFWKML